MTPDHNSAAAFLRRVGAPPWEDNSGQRSHEQRGCNDAAAALNTAGCDAPAPAALPPAGGGAPAQREGELQQRLLVQNNNFYDKY